MTKLIYKCRLYYLVPYGCALGLVAESLNCMSFPDLILMSQLYARVASYDTFNNIDSISNIRGDKVYIFHGTADTVVRPGKNCIHTPKQLL